MTKRSCRKTPPSATSWPISPSVDDSNIGNRDKKPPGEVPLVPSILPASAAPIVPMPIPAPAAAAPRRSRRWARWCSFWRWLFGSGASPAPQASASAPAQPQRERPAHRDGRPDRYRSAGGDRDRNRDRGDRDRNRDVRRDGPRDPRARRARPRGEPLRGVPRVPATFGATAGAQRQRSSRRAREQLAHRSGRARSSRARSSRRVGEQTPRDQSGRGATSFRRRRRRQ